ncbi:MAG: efflux RND transporter periplasmic adaptor subunit, partial [Spirochaetaceae bacterium]|nr:efflux RND transporter periplasmic adaptor subunit [Spirochaetaceae bacterium]
MKRHKRLALGLFATALLAALAFGASRLFAAPASGAPGEETVTVEKRVVDDLIEVSGHLKPRAEQEIRAPAAGIVAGVGASEGALVAKGDAIAALDSTEASFELEKLAYQIEQERFAGNRRKLALLEAELAMRRKAVEDLTIRAHLDGKISRLDLKPGDVLKAGESYGRVIDLRALTADVEIAEVDIPRAKVGLPVEFRFPALPGLTAKGRLASFPAEARINARGLSVLDAKLVIDAPPPGLLPAYTFAAVITAGEPREVLVVDYRAVTYSGGKPEVEARTPEGG